MEIGNRLFFSCHSNGFYEGKKLHKNLNLKDLKYGWKKLVEWISARWDTQPALKCSNLTTETLEQCVKNVRS